MLRTVLDMNSRLGAYLLEVLRTYFLHFSATLEKSLDFAKQNLRHFAFVLENSGKGELVTGIRSLLLFFKKRF